MEERVPCRVASNSHRLRIKEIQVQLVVLQERTSTCSNSLLSPVVEVALLQRERDLPQKQVVGGKQQSLRPMSGLHLICNLSKGSANIMGDRLETETARLRGIYSVQTQLSQILGPSQTSPPEQLPLRSCV